METDREEFEKYISSSTMQVMFDKKCDENNKENRTAHSCKHHFNTNNT